MMTVRSVIANVAFAMAIAGKVAAQTSDGPAPMDGTVRHLPPVNPEESSSQRLPPVHYPTPSEGAAAGFCPPVRQPWRPPLDSLPGVIAASSTPVANTSDGTLYQFADDRTRTLGTFAQGEWLPQDALNLPADFIPWWDAAVGKPLSGQPAPLMLDINSLIDGALRHSSYVSLLTTAPQIREAELIEQTTVFDWRTYLESTYDDTNTPIGSTLTTGTNANRYLDQLWSTSGGLRQRNALGGEVDLSQQFGHQANNSRFLVPNPQRTTQLQLQYTQPLLNGRGRAYNESRMVLAQFKLEQANDEVVEQLETHLTRVAEAYWQLYRARVEYLQRNELIKATERILENIDSRRFVDADQRQIIRAQSALARRRTDLIRLVAQIRDAESQLRLLVNDPILVAAGGREFASCETPQLQKTPVTLHESLQIALLNRRDISRAIREARSAAVELDVARHEILPKLDLVASSYVAGLAQGSDPGQAFDNQFTDGRPSYSVGLQFESPLGNRGARARADRRQAELNRTTIRFRLTVEEALTKVELAVREVGTSYRESASRYLAMVAAERETAYLNDRWQVLPGNDDSAAQLLDELLDAQQRVFDEQRAMAYAQVDYAVAMIRWKAATGTLLRTSTAALAGPP
jgi:outer membrane protein TolC